MTAVSFCLFSDSVTNDPVQWALRVEETDDFADEHLEAVDESPTLVKICSHKFMA